MSGQAGILRFNPRARVDIGSVAALAEGLDRIAPDGGNEYAARNIGMAFRFFHTTAISHLSQQPLVHEGFLLTWDGRLDNRNELALRLELRELKELPDELLVLGAYKKWGIRSFADLLGDWALALWDPHLGCLRLARDPMGVRRLFYRTDAESVAWCTIEEPLVRTAPAKLNLDRQYLAGCLYSRPPLESTAFLEIRAVPPSCVLTFRSGPPTMQTYWSLNPASEIRYRTDHEYEEHFRSLLRISIARRLDSTSPILAELSGGLDSSSIVCIADELSRSRSVPRVNTVSYYDEEEPSGDERKYFAVIERHRGQVGHHLSAATLRRAARDSNPLEAPDGELHASPGYSARLAQYETAMARIHATCGSRVLLSGIGGDELLGGVQYEAPELAEHLRRAELIPFIRSSVHWSLVRRKPGLKLAADTIHLLLASFRPEIQVESRTIRFPWTPLAPPGAGKIFRPFAKWNRLRPTLLAHEGIRFALAQQIGLLEPPFVGQIERRYPLLDRDLYVFLASIPRTVVIRPGERRRLMRRALHGSVPIEVLFRPTKWFGARAPVADLLQSASASHALFRDPWLSEGLVIDLPSFRKHLAAVEHGTSQDTRALATAILIEQWLRGPVNRYIAPI